MKTSKKFWFYLEPQVFIFRSENFVLLYDSITKQKLEWQCPSSLMEKLDYLVIPENLYVISLEESELKEIEISSFIDAVTSAFLGNIIPQNNKSIKPAIIPPILKLHETDNKTINSSAFDQICIYLNGECNLNCFDCQEYHRQFDFCTKNTGDLRIEYLNQLLLQTKDNHSLRIRLIGGNILIYKYIYQVIELLNSTVKIKDLCIHYLNFDLEVLKQLPINKLWTYTIFVTLPIDIQKLVKILNAEIQNEVEIIFVVTNEYDVQSVFQIINERDYDRKKISMAPFYNGKNRLFFEKYVFLNHSDMNSNRPTKAEIFARMTINTNDFGKLSIACKGEVYANRNFEPIGKTTMTLAENISVECTSGKSWFRIRDKQPCCSCLYQWLCPSPSNYEIVLGQENLCMLDIR